MPDKMKKASISTVSSEGTISPRDSVFLSPDLPETMLYQPSASATRNQSIPGVRNPLPHVVASPADGEQVNIKQQRDAEAPPAGPSRRRSTKLAHASTSPSGNKSLSAVSNNNNSKPMTARDRKRRQMHNASAMRSRIRLNETLDKMWKTIPLARRRRRLPSVGIDGGDMHPENTEELDEEDGERIGRADKVEVGIEYIVYLEDRVRELEERLNDTS